jgi:hypothetical protein
MPTLKAPKQVVFLVSLILAIVAWVTAFTDIAYIGGHPSILMTFAYIVLALLLVARGTCASNDRAGTINLY